MEKPTVKEIRERLIELGILPGLPDIIIGKPNLTKAAIKLAQLKYGLVADGIVGPLTEAAFWPEEVSERDDDVEVNYSSLQSNKWPRQRDVPKFYGRVGRNTTLLKMPYAFYYGKKRVRKFAIHSKVHDSALRVFEKVSEIYNEKERARLGFDKFSGCLNVRKMRGGSRYSMHSWAIAIDFDAARNPFRPRNLNACPLMHPDAEEFWKCWETEGWVSLGRTRGFDPMHVQAARL